MAANGINLQASDWSGQKVVNVLDVQPDASVGELVKGLLGKMSLPANDANGNPLSYQAMLDREGRHLHSSEVVSDVLQNDDRIVLQPNIDAGLGLPGG
jgi:hypothetical protein